MKRWITFFFFALAFTGLGSSPAPVRVAILDQDFAAGGHGLWMEALAAAEAPGAVFLRIPSGASLGSGLQALAQARQAGAQVVLFGYGHEGFNQQEYEAVDAASKSGVLLFAPAGNQSGLDLFPASYPPVFSTAASDSQGRPAPFTNLRQNTRFFAPGLDVVAPAGSNLRGKVSGTSYASAQVAGMAAALLASGLPPEEAVTRLKESRQSPDASSANGIPSLRRALNPAALQTPAAVAEADKPWRKRRLPNEYFAVGTKKTTADPKGFQEFLRAHHAQIRHEIPPDAFILQLPPRAYDACLSEGWIGSVHGGEVTEAEMAGMSDSARLLAGVWNDVFQGGLDRKGQEGPPHPGGALVGDALTRGRQAPEEAKSSAPIHPQGLYTVSPPYGASPYYDQSNYQAGRVAVSLFLVQCNGKSDQVRCTWTTSQENLVLSKVAAALAWNQAQVPDCQLSYVYDIHLKASCDYEPIIHGGLFCQTWSDNIVSKLGAFSTNDFNEKKRTALNADWAYSAFFVNDQGYTTTGQFTDGYFAFAWLGGPYLVMTYGNDGWGPNELDSVFVHESGHVFWTTDEYPGGQSASTRQGYFNTPNGNAYYGGTINVPQCPMRGYSIHGGTAHWCSYSKLHLGHRNLYSASLTDVLNTLPLSTWTTSPPLAVVAGTSVGLTATSQDIPLATSTMNSVTLNSIIGGIYRLNGGAWNAAALSDGLADRSTERLGLNTGALFSDTLVELRAINSQGNTETVSLNWTIHVGTPTSTRTISATRTVSPTHTHSPFLTPTSSFTVSPTPSPTFTPGPVTCTGNFVLKWGSIGSGNGQFTSIHGITGAPGGDVFVADRGNNRIQKFNANGAFLLKWGSLGSGSGQFDYPLGVCTDSSGNVYVADQNNSRIQKFDGSGNFLGTFGSPGVADGQLNAPKGVAVDGSGNIYVIDTQDRVQKFDATMAFVISWGFAGSATGQFSSPQGIALDSAGNVYVADTGNHRIQKFNSSGAFLLAWGSFGPLDGQFYSPSGVSVSSVGDVFVTDTNNGRIQEFSSTGAFKAKWGTPGSGDGQFLTSHGIACGSGSSVYATDYSLNRVQKFDCVTTVSPTRTGTHTATSTPTRTATRTMTGTGTATYTRTGTTTRTPSHTNSPTISATSSATTTSTLTALGTFTFTPTPTPHICGGIITVCKTGGCDYMFLKPALDAACDGDTVQVFGGDFPEADLVINKSLRLEGYPGLNWELSPIDQPLVGGTYSTSTLWIDNASPHSVTVTNISIYHQAGGDLIDVSATAGSSLWLDRIDFNGTGTGLGLVLSSGDGSLMVQNSIFRGEEDPASRGVRIDNASGGAGFGVVRYNTFRSLSPTVHVELTGANPYPFQLLGNIFFNDGSVGVNGLSLAGDPAATGDYNAWFGYSVFYGGLAPGSNDFPATDPQFYLPDLHFSPFSPLAYAGTNPGTFLDFFGDTRPAAAVWSLGAAEAQSATASETATPTETMTETVSPTVSATLTVTLSHTRTETPSPSVTFTFTPTFTVSPSFTVSPTRSATRTSSPTAVVPSATASPTAVPALTLELFSNNPNPFGSNGTFIPFRVSTACRVEVRVYTVSGEVVRDLPGFDAVAGGNEVFWDAKNGHGVEAYNGVFLYRVRATSPAGEVREGFRKCAVLK